MMIDSALILSLLGAYSACRAISKQFSRNFGDSKQIGQEAHRRAAQGAGVTMFPKTA
jgi:hypothetical protein